MIYPYYSPNLGFSVLLKTLFLSKKEAIFSLESYFRNLTGKKYILITNSCRTALYLTYSALEQRGEVITSPLTCKVAIDPIVESGNRPVYADVCIKDLNINPADIESRVNDKTIAIQTIHLGGNACDMDAIIKRAKQYKLFIIEDCAQALGAKYHGQFCGSFGDTACFSLIKNGYGIGGGILATNSKELVDKANIIQSKFKDPSSFLLFYRIVKNIAETYQNTIAGKILSKLLIKFKGRRKNYITVQDQLRRISPIELRIAAVQMSRYKNLHKKRNELGTLFSNILLEEGLIENSGFDPGESSFTKLFVYHPDFSTKRILAKLHQYKVEAMHLEQKRGSPTQQKLVEDGTLLDELPVYNRVHDSLISLPLIERYKKNDISSIIQILKNVKDERE